MKKPKAVTAAPLTPEQRKRYNVDDRVDKMMKKHNMPREDAEEVVREVVQTKEMPGDAKKAAEPEPEPKPVAKGVTGPLGALLNGQRFYVKGVVGNFILEGWQLAPGVFDANNQLRRVPKVAQITQRRTATRAEVSLKPVVMPAWFEETIVTVVEDFALLSASNQVQKKSTTNSGSSPEEGTNMAAKKKAVKKSNGAAKSNGAVHVRKPQAKLEEKAAYAAKVLAGKKDGLSRGDFAAALKKQYPSSYSTTKRLLIDGGYLKVNKEGFVQLAK